MKPSDEKKLVKWRLQKIFCIGFALFKAIDKSMNDAHYTANGGSWGVATRVYTSNHQALHSYLPGAISKTSRLPEGHTKMTSQIWPTLGTEMFGVIGHFT